MRVHTSVYMYLYEYNMYVYEYICEYMCVCATAFGPIHTVQKENEKKKTSSSEERCR